jgi:hypothetical protein
MSKRKNQANKIEQMSGRRKKQTAIADIVQRNLLPQANQLPLVECWITGDWDKSDSGLVQAVIVRQQPDNKFAYATFLIDVFCLGVKDADVKMNLTYEFFKEQVLKKLDMQTPMVTCDEDVIHQIVYQAVDYGAKWGFKPHSDFEKAKLFLLPRGTFEEPYTITFGKDGKPFYINGPYDNPRKIIAQLEKTAGPDNYTFLNIMEDPDTFF